jgi:RNA polymerase sigma factor (sigma-70 family)
LEERVQPTDEDLITACRRGDGDAWDLLVDRYQHLIYAIARGAGLDEEHAADTMQRVFTLLLERLDTIDKPAQVGAWLVVTARRDAWRTARRERQLWTRSVPDSDGMLDTLADRADLPDDQVLRLEAQHRVRQALGQLDGRCRELLTLLFLQPDPPTYGEVAVALGMREGAVGPTRARCLQKLRELLGDDAL